MYDEWDHRFHETVDLKYLSLSVNRFFAWIFSKWAPRAEQRHISLVFVFISQMDVYSSLSGHGTGAWKLRIRGLNERWICVPRGLSLNAETGKKKITQCKIRGAGRVWQSLKVFLGEILLYQPWLMCMCIDMKKFDSTYAWGWSSFFFFLIIFVRIRKNTVSVVFLRDALPCLAWIL